MKSKAVARVSISRLLPALAMALAASGLASPACALGLLETLTPEREIDVGRQLAREIERTTPLTSDQRMQTRVERVGQAIVEQVKPKVYPYQFKVLALSEINAFALPGGFIYVYEGMLAVTPSDDALSFVLAHEVAHAAKRHASKEWEKLKAPGVLSTLIGVVNPVGGLVADLAVGLMGASHSRQDENEADATSMEYMWQAGFDLEGATSVLQRFQGMEKGRSTPRFLRDHPPAKNRLGWIAKHRERLTAQTRPGGEAITPVEKPDLSQLVGELPEVRGAENEWFPLRVGNEWTYSVQTGQAKGAGASYTLRIMGSVSAPAAVVYRAEVGLGKTTTGHQLLATQDEVWKRPLVQSSTGSWELEYVTKVVGDQAVSRGEWRFSRQGVEAVSTPCGSFAQAVKIRKESGQGEVLFDAWFAEGVGLVKRVSAGGKVTELLTSYRLGEPKEATPEAVTEE